MFNLLTSIAWELQQAVTSSSGNILFCDSKISTASFPGKKNINLLIIRTSTRCFLRDAVSKICCHVKPVFNLQSNLPWVSDRPKCRDLEVTSGRWSFTRIKPQGISSKRRPGHFYFNEDNSLHVNSKVQYLYWHVVTKRSSYNLNSMV